MDRWKEEAMKLLKREALLRARNFKFKASVGIIGVWNMFTAILNIGKGPNPLKEIYLLQAGARHAATMKVTHVRSTANTQLVVKGVIRPEVQLERRIADTSVQIVTNLATDTILGTTYINENN